MTLFVNQDKTKKDYFGLEFALFLIVLFSIILQLLLGWGNGLSTLLRMIFVPGMVFLVGIYAKEYRNQPRFFIKRALLYYFLYMGFGIFREVLIDKELLIKTFARQFAFERISRPANIFFTFMVLFLVAIPLAKYMERILSRRWLCILLCIVTLATAFIPERLFGYPILGVFLGCDTYASIPLLPHFIFFLLGYCYKKLEKSPKKTACFSLIASVLFAGFSVIHFTQPLGKIMLGTFPVFVIYVITIYAKPYHVLRDWIFHIAKKCRLCYKRMKFALLSNDPKAKPLYFVLYTLSFFVMSALVFSAFTANHASFVWICDAAGQYVPRAYYFIKYVHNAASEFLKGNFHLPSYDFMIGMGSNISFSHDPLYWLMAFFKPSKVEAAYNFLTILRFYLTGLSASIFLLYYKKGYLGAWIGSMSYTFCGFALYSGVLHTQFLAPMMLLPMLIIATEEIYQKKRWYLCTIFTAISLLCSYYFIYMSTLAMGAYYVFRFIFETDKAKKNWKYFFTTTLTFACSYLLGVLIGNITLVTAFASFLGSGRSGSSSFTAKSPFYYNKLYLSRLYMYFTTAPDNPGSALRLGFIPLSYIAVLVLFIRKKDKFIKTLFCTCLACCLLPILAYVLSGFSSITNRWVYIFALLVSYITVHELPKLDSLSKKELKLILALGIPFVVMGICNEGFVEISVLASMALLLANYLVIVCMNHNIQLISKRTGKTMLLCLCILSIYIHGFGQYVVYTKNDAATQFVKKGKVYDYVTNTPTNALRDLEDPDFYRVSTAVVPLNRSSSSLMQGLNTLGMYSSTLNSHIVNYNIENGNTSSPYALIQSGNFNTRTFLDATACTKYYSVEDRQTGFVPYGYEKFGEKEIAGKKYNLYKNNYALPLGFTYDKTISESDLYSFSPIDRQELMLQAAVVADDNKLANTTADSLIRSAKELPIEEMTCSNGVEIVDQKIIATMPGASITFRFKGIDDAETYFVYDGELDPDEHNNATHSKVQLTCEDVTYEYKFFSKNYNYCAGQEIFLFNMGYRKASLDTFTLSFTQPGNYTFNSLKMYAQPMDHYEEYINNLSSDVLTDIQIGGDSVSGQIDLSEDKLLFLSIPYQKGWTAYVDGKETKLLRTNLMYMGLNLSKGSHQIRLTYEQPGQKLSYLLTAIGILIFILALLVRQVRKNKKKN